MNLPQRLRDVLLFVTMLSLLAAAAQTRAILLAPRPAIHIESAVESMAAGLKWHMLQIARNEQNNGAPFYPGN